MVELLKLVYWDYINTYSTHTSTALRIATEASKGYDEALDTIKKMINNDDTFEELQAKMYNSLGDVYEAYFMAGFDHAAKLLTNGKTDLLLNIEEVSEQGGVA